MNNIQNFTVSLASDTGLTTEEAQTVVQWLTDEGVLDFAQIEENEAK